MNNNLTIDEILWLFTDLPLSCSWDSTVMPATLSRVTQIKGSTLSLEWALTTNKYYCIKNIATVPEFEPASSASKGPTRWTLVNLLLVKFDQGVSHDVTHIDFASLLNHLRMLAAHQPSHMGKEEATLWIVRVRVCLAELVVHPVIPYPVVHGVLKGEI